ncbi:MAG: sn-glycerol-3-phosphate ABC transporter ATP-binding protein UgpC [candidate division NC10 bacterium]|nr:sn-glycerol-3-phosphate ABC transporter ATP-binding protein UgpC [candidate division NC10 bacterium]
MATIALKNVTKCYTKGVPAVKNFSLEIADQEFIVFLGPSGCGKTTVLRMIAGLEDITEGQIHIGEALVNDMAPRDRDVAMVFQNYAIYPHLTVYGNLAFGLKARKVPKPEMDERVRAAAKMLGIDRYLDRKPRYLSGGERQRVALGRAIVRNPKLFLMDEPLSNLDAKLRVHMRFELSQLRRKLGVTTVYVTHDQVEALTLGDRLVLMNAGEIQQVADPDTIYNRPANIFVASFVGSPSMNFFDAQVVRQNGALWLAGEVFRIRVTPNVTGLDGYVDKPVVCGFRPEAVALVEHAAFKNKSENLDARIDDVEPVGENQLIYVSCGKILFVSRKDVASGGLARHGVIGKTAHITLDMDQIHIFDKTTERAIHNP